MSVFSQACHFWSHDRDGSHITQSAIAKNPKISKFGNFMALSSLELELLRTRMYKVLKTYTDDIMFCCPSNLLEDGTRQC